MMNNSRAEITVNAIFYILMALFMIAIIVFGMQKLFFTKDIISEQERLEIQQDLIDALEYCDDPLNSGNVKFLEFRNEMFNGICILGDDFSSSNYFDMEGFGDLYDGGDNVVLLKTGFYENDEGVKVLGDKMIVDSFGAKVDIAKSFCVFDRENTGVVQIDVKCE